MKIADNQFGFQRFLSFRYKDSEKNIDVLISKRQKPQGTRLANNLSRTPAYLLLPYFQYLRPYPNFVDSQIAAFLSKMESPTSKPAKRGCDHN